MTRDRHARRPAIGGPSMQQVQYLAGDVLASVGVLDDNPLAIHKHVAQIGHRNVGAAFRVVEPTIAFSFDQNRLPHA